MMTPSLELPYKRLNSRPFYLSQIKVPLRKQSRKGIFFMSITVDTINLRFNVKPDYNQQQLQKLADDLRS